MTHRSTGLMAVALLAVTLCGCAGTDASPGTAAPPAPTEDSAAPTPTPTQIATPTPTPAGSAASTYSTIDELREAVAETGYDCDEWRQDDQVTNAVASGWCGSPGSLGLSTYASPAERDAVVALSHSSIEPGSFLVGPNWLITFSEGEDVNVLGTLQPTLGGEIRHGEPASS